MNYNTDSYPTMGGMFKTVLICFAVLGGMALLSKCQYRPWIHVETEITNIHNSRYANERRYYIDAWVKDGLHLEEMADVTIITVPYDSVALGEKLADSIATVFRQEGEELIKNSKR